MKILYLCPKKYFINKMSRGRFHSVKALSNHRDVQLIMSGPGFDVWKDAHHAEKHTFPAGLPDIVFWYKPLEMNGYEDVCCPKVITYNETFATDWTRKEIDESRSDLVIFHHENDLPPYRKHYADGKPVFVHIPHSAEKTIYKPMNMAKATDVLLIGAIQPHYPLRMRLRKIIKKMPDRYRCKEFEHPGYELFDAYTDRYAKEYAQAINQAKICVTCSGKPRSLFAKYLEVPMCGTALAADLPGQDHEAIKKWLIEIDLSMTDEQIMEKLIYYLEHEAKRNALVRDGLDWAAAHDYETYANKFVKAVKKFLENRK